MIKKYFDFIYEFTLTQKPIADTNRYLEEMQKGLLDKLFFNKIDLDCLVDFGCADGILLNLLYKYNSNIDLIGYDIDIDMINISKTKYPKIKFESNWSNIINDLNNKKYDNPAIFLSSVIHEVYSYGSSKEIRYFWNNQVFNNNFKYVIIRDMIPAKSFEKMNLIDINKIKQKSDQKYLNEFQNIWGDIGLNFRVLLHWLLKYRYIDNWHREVHENYLPLTIETLKNKIPNGWSIIFEDNYTYDYIKQQVKKDFDVDLQEPTHLKMIIQNNNF